MYIIRKFQPTDMFSIIKLASDTLTEQYNPTIFNYFYETYPNGIIIAEKAHKIIGFIIGVKIKEDYGKIIMLTILEKHRRKKIGSLLLNQLMKEFKKDKIKNVDLEVRKKNKKAIKFYSKHDFEIIDKKTHYYQNGSSAYIMKKKIF